jgi:NADH:ubiquinone oxidoreductase subunit F (NADH-binding)
MLRDMVSFAAGVARFRAVESCGQCTPCKLDGIDLATLLDRLTRSNATAADLEMIEQRIGTVGYGARCSLAAQQQTVPTSIFNEFRPVLTHRPGASASRLVIARRSGTELNPGG